MEHEKILSRREVAAIFGVSVVTLWRMVRRGMFPAPFRISPGRVGWRASTVERWIDQQEAAVRGKEARAEL